MLTLAIARQQTVSRLATTVYFAVDLERTRHALGHAGHSPSFGALAPAVARSLNGGFAAPRSHRQRTHIVVKRESDGRRDQHLRKDL
jgi:hypothetical protein